MYRPEASIYRDAVGAPQQESATDTQRTTIVPAPEIESGLQLTRELPDRGVDMIQLCGANGPLWQGPIVDLVNGRVRAGITLYGYESLDSINAALWHRILP